jgi:hypothetical protein
MRHRQFIALTALALGLALAGGDTVSAQGKKSDKAVKASARADKPGDDGKQVVTITLEIDKEYKIYANPVGNEMLTDAQTTVSITGKEKLASVKVDYPAGELVKDKTVGDYMVYKGKTTIKAVVQRAKGDTGPLNVAIALQACTEKSCLLPATIKVNVP